MRTPTTDPMMIPMASNLVSRYGGVTGSSDDPKRRERLKVQSKQGMLSVQEIAVNGGSRLTV